MNSFTLTAVGNLARNPEAVAKGDTSYTRFCLVGTDYAGKDDEGTSREIVTSIWFVAFGPLAESIVQHARKGDQLIVEARIRANIWTDKQGEKQYAHDFVVQGFRFGAPGKIKREEREVRREGAPPRGDERANGREIGTQAGGNGDGTAGDNGHVSVNGSTKTGGGAKSGVAGAAVTDEKPSTGRASRRATAPPP